MSLLRPGVIKQHKPNQTKPFCEDSSTVSTSDNQKVDWEANSATEATSLSIHLPYVNCKRQCRSMFYLKFEFKYTNYAKCGNSKMTIITQTL